MTLFPSFISAPSFLLLLYPSGSLHLSLVPVYFLLFGGFPATVVKFFGFCKAPRDNLVITEAT